MHDDSWEKCLWDTGEVRLIVRGMVKCLIQARWLHDPEFLPDDQVNVWFPPDGQELRDRTRSCTTLLKLATINARRLQVNGVLSETWPTSYTKVDGPPVAQELVSAVHWLLSGDVRRDDPVAALEDAVRDTRRSANWTRLIDWSMLPVLFPLLEQLPDPNPRKPAVVPHWDPGLGVLKYGRWKARQVAPNALNIRTLLDAFEIAGWPSKVASPFHGKTSAIKDTLARLGDGLARIRFTSARGGTEVSWSPAVTKARTPKPSTKNSLKRRPADR